MDDTYSSWTGLIYIFNLIVGTGALTIPAAFIRSGWLLGSILMGLLAFISYVTTTFVVESMATSNALMNLYKMKQLRRIGQYIDAAQSTHSESGSEDNLSPDEDTPLTVPGSIQNFPSVPATYYTIDKTVELGEMAGLLFSRGVRFTFLLCLILYLYGDVSIGAAAIGNSLVNVVCTSNNFTDPDDKPCWADYPYTTLQAYRVFLFIYLLLFGPFVFFNVQKTKYLQITTTLTRWIAFGLMISLTVQRLTDSSVPHNNPSLVVVSGFPSLLSSCVYAFMCHHSLPSMLAPISDKSRLNVSLACDYFLVLSFYVLLAIPAVFAFPSINNLFTLNFVPLPGEPTALEVADYFLILFPVFTISASFPIISVTLRNNLQSTVPPNSPAVIRNLVCPLVAVIPPILMAVILPSLEFLVNITGSYAGVVIQYILPAVLVLVARRVKPPELEVQENPYASPFRSAVWPLLVILWSLVCMSFVTYHFIKKHLSSDV